MIGCPKTLFILMMVQRSSLDRGKSVQSVFFKCVNNLCFKYIIQKLYTAQPSVLLVFFTAISFLFSIQADFSFLLLKVELIMQRWSFPHGHGTKIIQGLVSKTESLKVERKKCLSSIQCKNISLSSPVSGDISAIYQP